MHKIKLFTDGSSRGNPGPGGYGIVLKFNEKEKLRIKDFLAKDNLLKGMLNKAS